MSIDRYTWLPSDFAQDGGEIPRDQWFDAWPRSKKGNEWVRAFGLTYTIKTGTVGREVEDCDLVVVGPGGVRFDGTFEGDETYLKEMLWPEDRERPFNIEELQQGEAT